MSTLYLIRHGETEAKKEGLVCGITDSPLTAKGKEQMKKIGASMKHISFDCAYISTLIRSKESLSSFLLGYGKNLPVHILPELREINYGKWENKRAYEYDRAKRIFLREHPRINGLSISIDKSSESYEKAGMRMKKALHQILKMHPKETVLVINHSGNMRSLILTNQVSSTRDILLEARKGDIDFGKIIILKSTGQNLILEK